MPALTRAARNLQASDECWLGLEGIVSKRLDSPYRSGPSKTWLKSKNPPCEAVRRERGRLGMARGVNSPERFLGSRHDVFGAGSMEHLP